LESADAIALGAFALGAASLAVGVIAFKVLRRD